MPDDIEKLVERLRQAIKSGYSYYDRLDADGRAQCAFRDAVEALTSLQAELAVAREALDVSPAQFEIMLGPVLQTWIAEDERMEAACEIADAVFLGLRKLRTP